MQRVRLRCHYCGRRAEFSLEQAELRKLQSQGYLDRLCVECRDNTRWESLSNATAKFRALRSGDTAGRKRILVIDDDESILSVVSKALDSDGYDLETFSSARDALNRLARADFDLILSDIRMPGFDGKQLFDFLSRQLPEYKTRVIFLTGDTGNPETMAFLAEAGAPHLVKPLDIPKLLDLVRIALASAKAHSA